MPAVSAETAGNSRAPEAPSCSSMCSQTAETSRRDSRLIRESSRVKLGADELATHAIDLAKHTFSSPKKRSCSGNDAPSAFSTLLALAP
jgi:hypothetical protein